jgi:hypothetical protein
MEIQNHTYSRVTELVPQSLGSYTIDCIINGITFGRGIDYQIHSVHHFGLNDLVLRRC